MDDRFALDWHGWGPPMLPRVGAAEAAASRRLFRGRAPASVTVAGRTLELTVAPPGAVAVAEVGALCLPLAIGGAVGRVDLSRPLLRALLDPVAPGLPDDHPDIDLLLELALEEPLAALEAATGRALALRPPGGAVPADLGRVGFRVARDGMTLGHVGLRLAPAEMALVIEALDRLPAHSSRLGAVPVPVSAQAGSVTLLLGVLRTLRRGDVVVLDEAAPWGTVRLEVAGRPMLNARIQPEGLAVVARDDRRRRGSPAMDDTATPPSAPAAPPPAPAALDDVTVRIVCELGRCDVTLAELGAIRPGYVLDLGRAGGAAVDLMVRGQLVGKAELVQMDGAVGARVLRLFDHE